MHSTGKLLAVKAKRDLSGVDDAALKQRIEAITVWKRGTQRAPHKPLLLLYALGRCARGEPRLIPYADVDRDLRKLLLEFGPERKSYHPEYPFWRLQNDGIWELANAEVAALRRSNTDAKKTELLKHNVAGGFTSEIQAKLCSSPRLIMEIAVEILARHFPASIFEDVLQAVGLDIVLEVGTRRKRDPAFRNRVLVAYEFQCAVCGYDIRLGVQHLGLEAAHIKWHQAGGPDIESNGLALCALHHKLFDRGAFSLLPNSTICVSQQAHGSTGFGDWLLAFHGSQLRAAQASQYLPDPDFSAWHRHEVFRGPARVL